MGSSYNLICSKCGAQYETEFLELGNVPQCIECGGDLFAPGYVSINCKCGFSQKHHDLVVADAIACPLCQSLLSIDVQDCSAPEDNSRIELDPNNITSLNNMTIGFAQDADLLKHPAKIHENWKVNAESIHNEEDEEPVEERIERPGEKTISVERVNPFDDLNNTINLDTPTGRRGGLQEKNFGKYEIKREIARGGMGIVYEVYDPDLRRDLALKVLIEGEGANEEVLKRFLREARSTAGLKHPNIIGIHEMGQINGEYYFTMELIKGPSFRDIIIERKNGGGMSVRDILKHMRDVAAALQVAHDNGIYHRDLKPANIMLQEEADRAIVMDFGLAKDTSSMTIVSMTGQVLGSPAYMSPEQAQGLTKELDHRTDIYSLGVILYEAITKVQPFTGETVYDTISMVVNDDPAAPKNIAPDDVDTNLQNIILKCLEKEPEKRYQAMVELVVDIDSYLAGQKVTAKGISLTAKVWRKFKKRPVLLGVTVMMPLVIVAFFLSWYVFKKPSYVEIAKKAIASGDFDRQVGALRELAVYMAAGKIESKSEMQDALKMMRESLKNGHPDITEIAIKALGKIKDTKALPGIVALAGNKTRDKTIRLQAIKAINEIGGSKYRKDETLIGRVVDIALDKKDLDDVRVACIDALGPFMSKQIIPALTELATNAKEKSDVRVAATTMLGKKVVMGHPAMKEVVKLYADRDEAVAAAAKKALKHVRKKDSIFSFYGISNEVGKAYEKIAKIELMNQQRNQKLLDLMSDDESKKKEQEKKNIDPYKIIVLRLKDPKAEVRMTAAYDLANLKLGKAVPELQKLLLDKDSRVKRIAAKAIVDLATVQRPDIKELYCLLRNKKSLVREQAVYIVGSLDKRKALKKMLYYAKSEKSRRVMAMYAQMFVEIGDAKALPVIHKMVERSDKKHSDTGVTCVEALAAFGHKGVPYLIDSLTLENKKAKNKCLEELIEITGADYGFDVSAWKLWYKSQKK